MAFALRKRRIGSTRANAIRPYGGIGYIYLIATAHVSRTWAVHSGLDAIQPIVVIVERYGFRDVVTGQADPVRRGRRFASNREDLFH